MKNWKDWALGLFTTLVLVLGGGAYTNIQKDVDTILENQKIAFSQVNVNTNDINTIKLNLTSLDKKVDKNLDYTNAKFDLYESNLREFYTNMKFKPVTQIIHKDLDTMYYDRKYYNSLYSMFDVPFDITVNP